MTDGEFRFIIIGALLMAAYQVFLMVRAGKHLRAVATELLVVDAKVRATKLSGSLEGHPVRLDSLLGERGLRYRVGFEPLNLGLLVKHRQSKTLYTNRRLEPVDISKVVAASGEAESSFRLGVSGTDPAAVQSFLNPKRLQALNKLFYLGVSDIWVTDSEIICKTTRDRSQERIIEILREMVDAASALSEISDSWS